MNIYSLIRLPRDQFVTENGIKELDKEFEELFDEDLIEKSHYDYTQKLLNKFQDYQTNQETDFFQFTNMLKEIDPNLEETDKINEFIYQRKFNNNFIRRFLCCCLRKPFYKLRLYMMTSKTTRMLDWKKFQELIP